MTEQELTLIVGELRGEMRSISSMVSNVDKKLDCLPCTDHIDSIKRNKQYIESLIEWKKTINGVAAGEKIERYKGFISFKYAAILIVITNVVAVLLTVISRIWIP
uniref:Uncharacterized protein n=1 Tax=viral metagenome TaxID=1070528 RepID=A0A6M3L793_9ZZZZ